MATYRECEVNKDELADLLVTRSYRQVVNGVGLAKSASGDWYFKVNLRFEPSEKLARKLPATWQGIHVEYDVVGEIRAL